MAHQFTEEEQELIDTVYETRTDGLLPSRSNEEYLKMLVGLPYDAMNLDLLSRRILVNDHINHYNTEFSLSKHISSGKEKFVSLDTLKKIPESQLQEQLDSFNLIRFEYLKQNIIGSLGNNAFIEPPVFFDYGFNTKLGKSFYCNFNCVFLDCAPITIGNNVMFGPNVQILTATHPVSSQLRNFEGLELTKEIVIEDNCWLGGGVIVCPGVRLGKNMVVAAGSVVVNNCNWKDIENKIIGGVPAKVIKEIDDEKEFEKYSKFLKR